MRRSRGPQLHTLSCRCCGGLSFKYLICSHAAMPALSTHSLYLQRRHGSLCEHICPPPPHQQHNTPFCCASLNLGFAQASHKPSLVCVGVWHGSGIRLNNHAPPVVGSGRISVLPCQNGLRLLYIADTAQTHGVTSVPRHPRALGHLRATKATLRNTHQYSTPNACWNGSRTNGVTI